MCAGDIVFLKLLSSFGFFFLEEKLGSLGWRKLWIDATGLPSCLRLSKSVTPCSEVSDLKGSM